jgi:hypothetical protein
MTSSIAMAGKGIPIFNGVNFTHWKLKAEWFLASIHDEMLRVIQEGPIIPGRIVPATLDANGIILTPEKFVEAAKSTWTDLDRQLYALDFKAKSILGNAVTEPIFAKISGCKTAKAIWDMLTDQYDGVSLVQSQKKKNLIRNYENFSAGQNESLTDIHTRFQILINDLERYNIIKGQFEICAKFVDVIPNTFSEVITSLIVSEKLETYDLSGLFGLLLNFEETKARKDLNAKRIAKDPSAALVATTRKNRELFSRADYHLTLTDSESDDETESLEAEMALLAQRLEKARFKGSKGRPTFDPKKATCYKCGQVGHISSDCRVKIAESSSSDKWEEKAKKYKKKYFNSKKIGEKQQPKKLEKALVVEQWIDEESSSSEDDEDMCLMAITESQFDKDVKFAEKACVHPDWDRGSAYNVNHFKLYYSDAEKQKMFEHIYVDFLKRLEEIQDLKTKLSQVQKDLQSKVNEINQNKQYKLELDAQYDLLKKIKLEKEAYKNKADHYERICKSWCISSLKNVDCLSKQIPAQIQAVIGDEFDLKSHINSEINSKPTIFVPEILPHTFSHTVGDKVILTNAFVRPKIVTKELVYETEPDSEDTDSEISVCETSQSEQPELIITNESLETIELEKKRFIKGKVNIPTVPSLKRQKEVKGIKNKQKGYNVFEPSTSQSVTGPDNNMPNDKSKGIKPVTKELKRSQSVRSNCQSGKINFQSGKLNSKSVCVNTQSDSQKSNLNNQTETIKLLSENLMKLTTDFKTFVESKQEFNRGSSANNNPKSKRTIMLNRKCYNCGNLGHEGIKCTKSILKQPKAALIKQMSSTNNKIKNREVKSQLHRLSTKTAKELTSTNSKEPIKRWVPKSN